MPDFMACKQNVINLIKCFCSENFIGNGTRSEYLSSYNFDFDTMSLYFVEEKKEYLQ